MDIKHHFEMSGDKAIFQNTQAFKDDLKRIKKGYILVKKEQKNKSYNQSNYYWGVVIKYLCDYFGYEKNEMHSAVSMLFLSEKKNGLTFIRSTSMDNWSAAEWELYMDRVRRWAVIEYNILIPLPNEVL